MSRPPARFLALGEGLVEIAVGDADAEPMLACGGDAANVCVMAARRGAEARLAGRVGDDALGRLLLAGWRRAGVDVTGVRSDAEAPTGLYVNEAAGRSHRFTYWRAGSAGSRLSPADLEPASLEAVDAVVVTGVTLAVSATSAAAAAGAATAARERGAQVVCVLNHRPALGGDSGALAEFAARSDIVIGSRDDAREVFGSGDPASVRAALASGPELLLSDGGRPAVALDGERAWSQPVPETPLRNAGGAGDAMAGAYLSARLRAEPIPRALAWGVAAATLSVRQPGCASAYPSRAETLLALESLRATALEEGMPA
jgi:2-dehydro-3-deoxygluconokinase